MTRAADRLAGLLARLGPTGMAHPGKPAKRGKTRHAAAEAYLAPRRTVTYEGPPDAAGKPTILRPFSGILSPSRCGAVQTQTRSMRLDVETSTDLAGALAAIEDPLDYQLVLWTVLIDWRNDVAALRERLSDLLVERALRAPWPRLVSRNIEDIAEKSRALVFDINTGEPTGAYDGQLLPALVDASLEELRYADACPSCGSQGQVLAPRQEAVPSEPVSQSDKPKAPPKPRVQWAPCVPCGGTGRIRLGLEKRAKRLGIRKSRFKEHDARFAYDWLVRECNSRLNLAAQQINDARGK